MEMRVDECRCFVRYIDEGSVMIVYEMWASCNYVVDFFNLKLAVWQCVNDSYG